MPLLDHFHPPLFPGRRWESFHSQWAGEIAAQLNTRLLPRQFYAEVQVHVGPRIEVDVATLHTENVSGRAGVSTEEGGVAVLEAPPWAPPRPTISMPAIVPTSVSALVYRDAGKKLVAAIELVSPGNKDRAEYCRMFAAKCATYLGQKVGLVVIDVVTTRGANLHNELVELMLLDGRFEFHDDLYACAYRPVRNKDDERIDVWHSPLEVGKPLPVLPLALGADFCVRLDLETSYTEARQRSRLD